ncbi:MAG: hypothetical protein Q8N54_14830 [Sulfurimicrobium sp.]|jgi:hypothetical protein|nr:hypothetical protein [Sulfurimicrobium sp.]
MTLSALMKKGGLCAAATAIPATAATEEGEKAGTVARVATVAVANPPSAKSTPTAPMPADEESAIRAWLVHIEETDAAIIAVVLNQCRADTEARGYFLRQAGDVPQPAAFDDDRRYCDQCMNLRRDVCTIAEPKIGALVVANRGYRPVREPPRRCAGYAPGPDDPDRRPGRERWPGLIRKGSDYRNA